MPSAQPEAAVSLATVGEGPEGLRLRLGGHLDTRSAALVWDAGVKQLASSTAPRVVIDASGLEYCDGGGVAMLAAFDEQLRARGAELVLEGFPAKYEPILELAWKNQVGVAAGAPPPPPRGFVTRVGHAAEELVLDLRRLIAYAGEVIVALAVAALRPHRVRWSDMFRTMQEAGVKGFPVVFLISFLLGLILAYQTAGGFHKYGADVFMANMLGVAMIRELGPLMTAIMLTARSGSAFAAEIGTMRVNEEVDALTTMALDPVRFLATPRIIAAVLMMPILTVFANIAGIIGGGIVWVISLDLPLSLYKTQLMGAISVVDLLGGLFKAFVFGILVAAIGCIRGLQTRGGAIAVGKSTTSAVVSGIVLIALADMILAVIFYYLEL